LCGRKNGKNDLEAVVIQTQVPVRTVLSCTESWYMSLDGIVLVRSNVVCRQISGRRCSCSLLGRAEDGDADIRF
jgi:hypothetical protein